MPKRNTITIDGIPVFAATLGSDDTGMLRISLVDAPAVMSDFLAFAHQEPRKAAQLYRIEDEDKRLVFGVVMRADFPIYRYDKSFGEYYIIYKPETIREMAEKYLADDRQNAVDLMHDGQEVEGVKMVQYFIKDTARGVAPSGFAEDIADGSLFAEFHITDDDIWAKVKDGTYRGFSLEGIFDLVPERDGDYVGDIVDRLGNAFSKLFKNTNMSKLTRIKAALRKVLEAFGNVSTDRGVLAWDGDEDLKVGDAVYIENEEGERETAPDGDYVTADNKTVVVADGKVAEIRDPEAEVAPAEPEQQPEDFGSIATDNGTLEWDGDEDLREGDEVFVRNADGEREAAADGEYRTEDGKTITVVDGKVASIADPEAEVAPEGEDGGENFRRTLREVYEQSYDEKVRRIYDAIRAAGFGDGYIVEAGDDFAVFASWDADWNDVYTRFDVSWTEEGEAVVSNPVKVKPSFVPVDEPKPVPAAEAEELRRQVADLSAEVERLKKKPAAAPAHEQYTAEREPVKTGIKGLDRIATLMSAK